MKKVILLLAVIVAACALSLTSCNLTRVVTTSSSYFTKGDTTCTIVTKTTESYDATKKAAGVSTPIIP